MRLRPSRSRWRVPPKRRAAPSIGARDFSSPSTPEPTASRFPAPGLARGGDAAPRLDRVAVGLRGELRGAEDENDGKALATDALDRLDPTETPAARHGLALALADATARSRRRAVAGRAPAENENLPAPTETVPVNATIGDVDSEDTVAAAENAVEKGSTA